MCSKTTLLCSWYYSVSGVPKSAKVSYTKSGIPSLSTKIESTQYFTH